MSDPSAEPTEIRHKRSARCVLVTWSDGHLSAFPLNYLRSWCPCAICQGHADEARYLDVHDQELVHVDAVGNLRPFLHLAGRSQHGDLPLPFAAAAVSVQGCDGSNARP